MSARLFRLSTFVVRHACLTLAAWLVVVTVLGALAATVGGSLSNDFTIPGVEAQRGLDSIAERFPQLGGTDAHLVYTVSPPDTLAAHRESITAVVSDIAAVNGVNAVTSPFGDEYTQPVLSEDGHAGLSVVQFNFRIDSIDHQVVDTVDRIAQRLDSEGVSVHIGGRVASITGIPLSPLEAIGVVLALIVLVVMFRSLLAAIIPIISALIGVGVAMSTTMLVARVIPISTTTPTLAIMLGLAVGIDYALFIVSRHREQLAEGYTVEDSIPRAIATSGGAVLFAAMTVVIALLALIVAHIPFLTVMGACAAFAVAISGLVAVTALPAMLVLAGMRLRPSPRRSGSDTASSHGRASRWWVRVTTRHPVVTIGFVMVMVVAMSVPALSLRLALPDNGVESPHTEARQTYDLISDNFGAGMNGQILIVTDIVASNDPLGVVATLREDIAAVDGVERIQLATPNPNADMAAIVIVPEGGPDEASTAQLIHTLRAHVDDWERDLGIAHTTVTGMTALAIDISQRLAEALLPFALVVVGLSLILLAAVFRSIWVPITAALGYLFSVGAAFGMTALVFIDGWGNSLLHIGQVGPVISFMPIIVMGVLFGLAMDYEVFLVSRMREEWVREAHATGAIRRGFTAAAPVVVTAALIMICVFSGFIPGGSFYVQPIAFGLAVGVAVDAFLVRMTLIPAVLELLSTRAWALPASLDRMLPTIDVEGADMDERFRHLTFQKDYGEVVARAHEVAVSDRHGAIVSDVDLVIRPGEAIRLDGDDLAIEAVTRALAGCLRIDAGSIFVFDTSAVAEPSRVNTRALVVDSPGQITCAARSRTPMLLLICCTLDDAGYRMAEDQRSRGGALVLTPRCRRHHPHERHVTIHSATHHSPARTRDTDDAVAAVPAQEGEQ